LLRASGKVQSGGVDIQAVIDSDAADASGIAHAAVLSAFAEAAVRGSEEDLRQARTAVISAMGHPAMIDAAGVIGNFQRMNRIADGIGLELDAPMRALTTDVGATLGLRNFSSAANTQKNGFLTTMVGKLVYPLVVRFLKPSSITK
jgi:hypothetical protein